MEFESVTTKGGDKGFTSLFDGKRVSKNSPTIITLNAIDSFNASVGMVRSNSAIRQYDKNVLGQIQTDLYEIMGIISGFPKDFSESKVNFLERKQKLYMRFCNIPNVFINFGDNPQSAQINSLRTSARGMEICYLTIKTDPVIMKYFNRLSDLLYVMSLIYEEKHRKISLLKSTVNKMKKWRK